MKKILALSTVLLTALTLTPVMAESPEDLFRNGKFFGELRYRYENVEQDGLARTATAQTLRANLGFETGSFYNFKALIEGQSVQHLNDDHFNDTTNGLGTYPVVADPENNEFNQAWIMWSGIPKTDLKLGRQNIMFDNQRFVGNVGWRQNDQTYDAATVTAKPVDKLVINYNYVWNVNRIFGEYSAIPDYSGDTHLLHLEYTFFDWLKAAAYGYFLDLEEANNLSSNTEGLQLTGKRDINSDWKFQYLAEYARQSDARDNPNNYSASYFHVTPSVMWKGVTLQTGFEVLGGDGVNAFQTPLATLHAHNGWADKFLTTPANGLEDIYARIGYKLEGIHQSVDGTMLDAVYHDYSSEEGSDDYGHEWNFQVSKTFKTEGFVTKDITLTAKYADYNADTFATDTEKFWLMAGVKF